MTPEAILKRLTARGIRVHRDGGNLIVSPSEALTDELRGLIRKHKAELLEAAPDYSEPVMLSIPHDGGAVEFVAMIPRAKFDPFAILELFLKHHGKEH